MLRSHISEYSASAALFQCQHSTDQDGQVFIPNIPDLYFDYTYPAGMKDLLKSENGVTYFFTIPPESAERNCSGTVVAIQYCYWVHKNRINSTQDVFSFHSVTRDGFVFTVNNSFTERTTPLESKCTEISGKHYFCCDTATLSELSISSESYTFGVTIVDNEVTPYAFENNTEFVVEQFQGSFNTMLQPGTSYNLEEESEESDGLLLMRFLIGKLMYNLSYIGSYIIMC